MYHSPNLSVVQSIYIFHFSKERLKWINIWRTWYRTEVNRLWITWTTQCICVCVCVCVCVCIVCGVNAWASQVAQWVKNPPANGGDAREPDSILRLGRSPGGGHCNPLQYSCLENAHGQRSLVGCSLKGRKESNMTKAIGHACPCEFLSIWLIALLISQWHTEGCYYLKTQKCLWDLMFHQP